MKPFRKITFALCVTLFLTVPPLSAQENRDPENKEILLAAGPSAASNIR